MVLGLSCGLLSQALFLVLKLFALGNLCLKNGASRLELHLCVAKLDGIEAGFEESLGSHAFDVADESFFASEELVLARLLAPVLPGEELAISHLLPLLLHGVLEGQEDSLLERCLRDDLL